MLLESSNRVSDIATPASHFGRQQPVLGPNEGNECFATDFSIAKISTHDLECLKHAKFLKNLS